MNKKIVLIFLVSLLCGQSRSLFAQNLGPTPSTSTHDKFIGKVVDSLGNPIKNAIILHSAKNEYVVTDDNGTFVIYPYTDMTSYKFSVWKEGMKVRGETVEKRQLFSIDPSQTKRVLPTIVMVPDSHFISYKKLKDYNDFSYKKDIISFH